MKSIETKQVQEKKGRKNQVLIGLMLVSLMVLSTIGYAVVNGVTQSGQNLKYNGHKFSSLNGYWTTDINGLTYNFIYSPTQVSQRQLLLNKINSYYNKPLYINSESYDAEQEVMRNMYYVASNIRGACLADENCTDETLPVKTCADNFIIIREGSNEIIQNGNCVYISGEYVNLTLYTDEFLYKTLEIIK